MSKPSCLKDGKWHLLLLNQCPPPIISIFTAPVGSAIVKVILFCARFLMLTSNFLGELSIQVLNSIKTCNSCDWQAGFTFAVMKSYWLCMVGGLFFCWWLWKSAFRIVLATLVTFTSKEFGIFSRFHQQNICSNAMNIGTFRQCCSTLTVKFFD